MTDRETASEIEDVATDWAAKAERGLTEADRVEFDHWIEGDSRRLGAYVRAQAAWIHAERAAALGQMPEQEVTPVAQPFLHDEPQVRGLSRRMMLGGGAAIAASIAAGVAISGNRYHTLESGVGEIRHIALADGSMLTLDTDTRVDVAFSSKHGLLNLVRGKMFLELTGSQRAPLLIHAGELVLQMVTGAFDLQSLLDGPVVALVTEGRLFVTQPGGFFGESRSLTIDKGYALTLPSGEPLVPSHLEPVGSGQQAQLLVWRDGMLSFGGELLGDAVRSFDRYSSIRIYVDPSLAGQKVTGLFKADDPHGFASAVAACFNGVVETKGQTIRITAR